MLAVKAENISKLYRLGQVGTGTISHDLNRYWHKLRGKQDPYLKIGETNERTKKSNTGYVWSLQNINFEIAQGDAVGIIGKNGAGKSTLLKLLGKITKPTTGNIYINGRIASLLEVGTGFHPEMTGRENIFLNGAMLGMTRKEIRKKFDEIVDFSGVERYIDTPVKRYSSGMYVRLAFAVAAHLESEILIVDEVLAVGDSEFQKKCLGKMGEVSRGEGRTVLFVSHNMAAVQNLCTQGLLLHEGNIVTFDIVSTTIQKYLGLQKNKQVQLKDIEQRAGNKTLQFFDAEIKGLDNLHGSVESFGSMQIKLQLNQAINFENFKGRIDIGINDVYGTRIAWLSTVNAQKCFDKSSSPGSITFIIEQLPLAPGTYTCTFYCEFEKDITDWIKEAISFTVIEKDYYGSGSLLPAHQGNILMKYQIK